MKKLYYKIKPQIKKDDYMEVEVELLETKYHFGRVMCKIKPVSGEGYVWTNHSKLIIK